MLIILSLLFSIFSGSRPTEKKVVKIAPPLTAGEVRIMTCLHY